MLTEHEREWMERRKNPGHINKWGYPCSNPLSYDRLADFIDASEFEARVAVKLAQNEYMFIPCYLSGTKWDDCPHEDWDCNQCRIKYARLAVEQEMDDADRK